MKSIQVDGFKSFFEKQKIDFSELTIFAGANSSGKSSASQVLLLLKQTIESQYDPGSLLLEGPNVRFTSMDQILSKRPGLKVRSSFGVEIENDNGWKIGVEYGKKDSSGTNIKSSLITDSSGSSVNIRPGRRFSEADADLLFSWQKQAVDLRKAVMDTGALRWESSAARCFPEVHLLGSFSAGPESSIRDEVKFLALAFPSAIRKEISGIIHIQGLRGNPERTYSATARVVKSYQGLFTDYVASVLQSWQENQSDKLLGIGDDLRELGLSWKVRTSPVYDTQVEIRVSRLPIPTQGGAHDLVNLADVGIGVSQILPFLVALRAASKGQVVFVEQPEIHLHPRAQHALAGIVVAALKRGVRVWIETHSSIFLKGIQARIAGGDVSPDKVSLNWFRRDVGTGSTTVAVAKINELGQYGDWPADFDDVSLSAEREYLDAALPKLKERSGG